VSEAHSQLAWRLPSLARQMVMAPSPPASPPGEGASLGRAGFVPSGEAKDRQNSRERPKLHPLLGKGWGEGDVLIEFV
jgi:hypothetical protein